MSIYLAFDFVADLTDSEKNDFVTKLQNKYIITETEQVLNDFSNTRAFEKCFTVNFDNIEEFEKSFDNSKLSRISVWKI